MYKEWWRVLVDGRNGKEVFIADTLWIIAEV